MSSKAKDPLKAAADRETLRKAEEAKVEMRKSCKHPSLHFQQMGSRIRCADCKRYWIAGWVGPRGHETDIADYGYRNPGFLEGEKIR